VTGFAGLRESAANVIGIRGSLEVFHVARDAGVGGQVEIVVGVTVGTTPRRNGVRAG